MGRYSIVRYVEDVERGEGLNVGILLEGDDGVLRREYVERDRLSDSGVVRRFFSMLDATVAEGKESTLDQLVRRRFPHFTLSQPHAVTTSGDLEATLAALVDRLVSEPQHALTH